jgi:hypothetical protein
MPHLAFPRAIAFDRDYWLCRCEGFRVDCPTGRVGRVEEGRFGSRIDRPDLLVIQGGVLGRRRLLVPVADVEEVVPRQERIVVRTAPSEQRSSSADPFARSPRRYLRGSLRRLRRSSTRDGAAFGA